MDWDSLRRDLVTCLHATRAGSQWRDPYVVDPEHNPQLWGEASLPYNTRLASEIGPLAIVYPRYAEEISRAVACARQHDVPAVPRSGGHSYGAYSVGGSLKQGETSEFPRPRQAERSLIIDLRGFRDVHFDPTTETVTVGSGALLGEMNEELERYGRAVPSGSCPTVGVGGQVLAGGFGLTSRSLGLLLDNLLSVDLVLASGDLVTASPTQIPDLFWGLRGAGPSLGIAHSFTFRTYPMPQSVIYFELTLHPRSLTPSPDSVRRTAELYLTFQEFGATDDAVSELGLSWHVTPEPSAAGWGTKVEVLGQYIGTMDDFQIVIGKFEERLRGRGEMDYQIGQRQLTWLQSMHNTGGDWANLPNRGPLNVHEHVNFYAKSLITKRDIPRSAVEAHMTTLLSIAPQHNPQSNLEWFVLSPYLGGPQSAVTRNQQGAFAHRDVKIVWELYAKRQDERRAGGSPEIEMDLVEFVKGMTTDLGEPEAVYPAYVDPELAADKFPSLVYGDSYPHLQSLKRLYDPYNLFRQPQTVYAGPAKTKSLRLIEVILWLALAIAFMFLVVRRVHRALGRRKRRLA